jgi:hypothetical protein
LVINKTPHPQMTLCLCASRIVARQRKFSGGVEKIV